MKKEDGHHYITCLSRIGVTAHKTVSADVRIYNLRNFLTLYHYNVTGLDPRQQMAFLKMLLSYEGGNRIKSVWPDLQAIKGDVSAKLNRAISCYQDSLLDFKKECKRLLSDTRPLSLNGTLEGDHKLLDPRKAKLQHRIAELTYGNAGIRTRDIYKAFSSLNEMTVRRALRRLRDKKLVTRSLINSNESHYYPVAQDRSHNTHPLLKLGKVSTGLEGASRPASASGWAC